MRHGAGLIVGRILGSLLGLVFIVIGLPLMVSPIPLGAIMVFFGAVVLVASNPLAARVLAALRRRYRWLDRLFHRAETVLPEPLAEPLHETDAEEVHQDQAPSSPPMMTRSGYPRYRR